MQPHDIRRKVCKSLQECFFFPSIDVIFVCSYSGSVYLGFFFSFKPPRNQISKIQANVGAWYGMEKNPPNTNC